jgi:anti-sigma B factor antagonist
VNYTHLRLQDQGEVLVVSFLANTITDQTLIEQIGNEFADVAMEAAGNRKLILNFQGVKFMSSAMLGKLLPLHKRCKADKITLKLCNLSPNLMEVFKILNLTKVFQICGTEAEAVSSFGKHGFFR